MSLREYGTSDCRFYFDLDAAQQSANSCDNRTVHVVELMQRQRSDGKPVEDDEGYNIGYVVAENEPTSDELVEALGGFNIYKL